MSTPDLQLETLFVLDAERRITSTREPTGRAPVFALIRSATRCAWALRADVTRELAAQMARLASDEPPTRDLRDTPRHADRYQRLLGGSVKFGPAFTFPDAMSQPAGVVTIEEERLLERNFRGWVPGEIAAGRAPLMAVIEEGHPVSICFCARRSEVAAEAGVDTAVAFRRRGLAARVTAGWALAVRASGRIPLYSTSWQNDASLALARKLGLQAYASDWAVFDVTSDRT